MNCCVGAAAYHLAGSHCDPPVAKIIAGYNPWKVDRKVCRLGGLEWQDVDHIAAGLSEAN